MKNKLFIMSLAAASISLFSLSYIAAAEGTSGEKLIFQIGQFDNNDAEFANAPDNYSAYLDSFPDGCKYVAGVSTPAKDWNYIHPGLADSWADSTEHSWTIEFKLDAVPLNAQAVFTLDLIGAHEGVPPEINVDLNGKEVGVILTDPGTGSEYSTVEDQPGQVKTLSFPASLMKAGKNIMTLTNGADGKSWIVYDALSLSYLGR